MSPKLPGASEFLSLAEEALDRWAQLLAVGDVAAQRGLRLYIVGGTVRDLLLGVPPRDPDLVVEGSASDLAQALVDRFGGSLLLHAAFQTAVWTDPQGQVLDIASARRERYPTPAALPVVVPGEIDEDLARRDFSLNAMALSLHPEDRGAPRDPCGGLADLTDEKLRTLHIRSFHDDPTRAWRGARLATRLGLQLEEKTRQELSEALEDGAFSQLGLERLGAEIDRIAREPTPVDVLKTAASWGLLTACLGLPDASGWAADLADTPQPSSEIFWLCLARQLPPEQRERQLRLVPGDRHAQARWIHGPEKIDTCTRGLEEVATASRAGTLLEDLDGIEVQLAEKLASPNSARWIQWWREKGHEIRTTVDGDLLLAQGADPGPILGSALKAALAVAREGGDHAEQLKAALSELGRPIESAPL